MLFATVAGTTSPKYPQGLRFLPFSVSELPIHGKDFSDPQRSQAAIHRIDMSGPSNI